jgi:hypothetical protein
MTIVAMNTSTRNITISIEQERIKSNKFKDAKDISPNIKKIMKKL